MQVDLTDGVEYYHDCMIQGGFKNMFGPKKLTRQKIVERFHAECQVEFANGQPMDALAADTFRATQKTIAFDILRYQLSYMRMNVRAKLTHEHDMSQRYLVMANDYRRKGNHSAAHSMIEKVSQCTANMQVCNAFFRAVKDVVEK
jgi:hypothetical protein